MTARARTKAVEPITHPQTGVERAQVMQQLFKHLKDEAGAVLEQGEAPQKAKLRQELQTHAHLLQKTLDTIQRYARP